jgi:nucleoside-diphosphate-sugar epimerase
MNKILVTGSSGFVGKNLIKYFIEQSKNIISFSRNSGFDYNIIDYNYLNSNNINIIIHTAGKAHDLKNVNNDNEYFKVNTDLTINLYKQFLLSNSQLFITLSSVKAVAENLTGILTEENTPQPLTSYGKSKLLAEEYILSHIIPKGKKVFILRPCMIHGPGNKGNLNLLYKIVGKYLPWPLGAFDNKRSFCSIDNLCFLLNELIQNNQIPSGVYNIADDDALSTNELIKLIAESQGKKPFILNIPKFLIKFLSKLGDVFRLPLNTERLNKLTETYIVSNKKLKNLIKKPLPITSKEGLIKTFNSFNNA